MSDFLDVHALDDSPGYGLAADIAGTLAQGQEW